jgi:general secretion pathway protein G
MHDPSHIAARFPAFARGIAHPTVRRGRGGWGFTTVEVLVVVVIVALLLALVLPRTFGQRARPKGDIARAEISALSKALLLYRQDVGSFPSSEQGLGALVAKPDGAERWMGPYLKDEVPLDPWGRSYSYKSPGEHGEFDLLSYGADGKPGGTDENADIVSWPPGPAASATPGKPGAPAPAAH